jgi:predicted dehydrogenase
MDAHAEIVASGRLGEIHAVQTMFSYRNDDPDDIRNQLDFGGGGLMDIGCYCIDVPRMIFGAEPIHGAGFVRTDPTFRTDVVASAILEFEGERHASFICATRSAPDQRVHIIGSDAHLTVEVPFNAPPDQDLRLLVSDGWPGNEPEVVSIPAADQYALEGDTFARAVLDGEELGLLAPGSGVEDLRILTALRDGVSW